MFDFFAFLLLPPAVARFGFAAASEAISGSTEIASSVSMRPEQKIASTPSVRSGHNGSPEGVQPPAPARVAGLPFTVGLQRAERAHEGCMTQTIGAH